MKDKMLVQWLRIVFGVLVMSLIYIVLNYAEQHRKQINIVSSQTDVEAATQSSAATLGIDIMCNSSYNNYSTQKQQPSCKNNHGGSVIQLDEILKGPLSQSDPRILKYIQENYLIAPSKDEYNLVSPNGDPSNGPSDVVKSIFNYTRNRFFIETDVIDGETNSNTLSLEKDYGWRGLLIKSAGENLNLLRQKKRKAWIVSSCIANQPFPYQVTVDEAPSPAAAAKMLNADVNQNSSLLVSVKSKSAQVQCFPISSLVQALNISTVDFLSLDVNGRELDVLGTIPFQSIFFKVISVSFTVEPANQVDLLLALMQSNNFTEVTRVIHKNTDSQRRDAGVNIKNYIILAHKSISTSIKDKFPPVINN